MENIINSIDDAYQQFVNEITNFLEVKQACEGQPSGVPNPGSNLALGSLTNKWEAFKHACDQAEVFVESEKQRIACKSTVDNATAEVIGRDFVEDDSKTESEEAKVVEDDGDGVDDVDKLDDQGADDVDKLDDQGADDE